jgi:signal peptidase I
MAKKNQENKTKKGNNSSKSKKRSKVWLILVPTLVLILSCIGCSVTLVLAGTNYIPHQVMGNSMEPTLHDENYILGKKISPEDLERGDIIVYKVDETFDYVHRIVALPGDTVAVVDGKLYVNNQVESESLYSDATNILNVKQDYEFVGKDMNDSFDKIVVPENHVFVMGDNRDLAQDSRYLGPVEFDSVVDKVVACYWNCGDTENTGN